MRVFSEQNVRDALAWAPLIEALKQAFIEGAEVPLRHHHEIEANEGAGGTLLVMPAWQSDGFIGVKVVNVFPDNATRNLPSVLGTYLLMSGTTGELLAVIDGPELTARRTAAASVLAGTFLARKEPSRHLIVGAGRIAENLLHAWRDQFDIHETLIWNHNPERANELARHCHSNEKPVRAITNLEDATRNADIISTATFSNEPLVRGEWLKPGCHLDLVGSYSPRMREADDACVTRARIFIDTREGALGESGDLTIPLASGVITTGDICGELAELCRGEVPGRTSPDEITLFKSVGTAIEDLGAARLLYETRA